MSFKHGDKVVVTNPTEGLPAFKVSGKIYTVEADVDGMTRTQELYMTWASTRFEKYETKGVKS